MLDTAALALIDLPLSEFQWTSKNEEHYEIYWEIILAARTFSKEALKDLARFDGSSTYSHCMRVADTLQARNPTATLAMIVASQLHDVVEDTEVTLNEIEKAFGPAVRRLVDAVSRRKDEPYLFEFIPRIKQDPQAVEVKRFDILDNLSTLPVGHKLANRYTKALAILLDAKE